MLALDDLKGWSRLVHVDGSATDVPGLLAELDADPSDQSWLLLWSRLCREGRVFGATFAAVPHIVEMAGRRAPDERLSFLLFLGAVALGGGRFGHPPAFVRQAYEDALKRCQSLVVEQLRHAGLDEDDTVSLLSGFAAMGGAPDAAEAILCLPDLFLTLTCPACRGPLSVRAANDGLKTTDSPHEHHDDLPFAPWSPAKEPDGGPYDGSIDCPPRTIVSLAESSGHNRLGPLARDLFGHAQCFRCHAAIAFVRELSRQLFVPHDDTPARDPLAELASKPMTPKKTRQFLRELRKGRRVTGGRLSPLEVVYRVDVLLRLGAKASALSKLVGQEAAAELATMQPELAAAQERYGFSHEAFALVGVDATKL